MSDIIKIKQNGQWVNIPAIKGEDGVLTITDDELTTLATRLNVKGDIVAKQVLVQDADGNDLLNADGKSAYPSVKIGGLTAGKDGLYASLWDGSNFYLKPTVFGMSTIGTSLSYNSQEIIMSNSQTGIDYSMSVSPSKLTFKQDSDTKLSYSNGSLNVDGNSVIHTGNLGSSTTSTWKGVSLRWSKTGNQVTLSAYGTLTEALTTSSGYIDIPYPDIKYKAKNSSDMGVVFINSSYCGQIIPRPNTDGVRLGYTKKVSDASAINVASGTLIYFRITYEGTI